MLKNEHVHSLWMFLLIGIAILTIGITTYNKIYNDKLFKEIKNNTVIVKDNTVDNKNNGKLVLVSGDFNYKDIVKDDLFDINIKTTKLLRYVEVYQWYEYTEEVNGKKIYKYGKAWSNDLIDSTKFKEKGHDNPSNKIGATTFTVPKNIEIGEYEISQQLLNKLPCNRKVYLATDMSLPNNFKVYDNYITNSKNPKKPEAGDFRIAYFYNDWQNATILAKQSKKTFEKYVAKNKEEIYIIEEGILNLNQIIEKINNN